ncbi:MAG: hypothetical protein KAI47_01010 [Deltaproteobacteria bacterium]|nr:hypothetical protein [Deltaproteobacteria bacterium]
MRSRYSAYALNRAPYVIETTHPDGPLHRSDSTSWLRETEVFCEETRFEGLQVLDTARDDQTGDGWVTFHAQLSQRGRDVSFTERSRFVRHEGRWKYFDGKQR